MAVGMNKIRIEGIKLSEELVAVNFRDLSTASDYLSHFCQTLADNQINLVFLSKTGLLGNTQISLCAAINDQVRIREALAAKPGMVSHAEFISPVGLVSIFHHQFSLKILGLVLSIFGRIPLPLYGSASSLSSLTFITDYAQLNRAVEAIREHLDVPSDQIYLRQETRIVQSQEIKKE